MGNPAAPVETSRPMIRRGTPRGTRVDAWVDTLSRATNQYVYAVAVYGSIRPRTGEREICQAAVSPFSLAPSFN